MRCEIPELTRCCFCFPLRLGLIVWGYIKLSANLVQLIFMLLNFIVDWDRFWRVSELPFTVIYVIIMGSVLADIIFHIIFAVGAHKKDAKKVELFFKFCIYILVLYVLGLLLAITYFVYEYHIFAFLFSITIGSVSFCSIIIQIYIIILVRSEAMKLKRGTNLEFINHAAEPYINVKIDLNNGLVN